MIKFSRNLNSLSWSSSQASAVSLPSLSSKVLHQDKRARHSQQAETGLKTVRNSSVTRSFSQTSQLTSPSKELIQITTQVEVKGQKKFLPLTKKSSRQSFRNLVILKMRSASMSPMIRTLSLVFFTRNYWRIRTTGKLWLKSRVSNCSRDSFNCSKIWVRIQPVITTSQPSCQFTHLMFHPSAALAHSTTSKCMVASRRFL